MAGQEGEKEIYPGCFPYFTGYLGQTKSLMSDIGTYFSGEVCKQIAGVSMTKESRDTSLLSTSEASKFHSNIKVDERDQTFDYFDNITTPTTDVFPSHNFPPIEKEQMQKIPALMTGAVRELKTLLSREDAVDPGQNSCLEKEVKKNVKKVVDRTSRGLVGVYQGCVSRLKSFGIYVQTTTTPLIGETTPGENGAEQLPRKDEGSPQEHEENFEEKTTEVKLMAAPDELSTVEGREKTFQNSSIRLRTFRPLAEAGFYCIGGTSVKCFECGIEHYQWESRHIDPANPTLHRQGCGTAGNLPRGRGRGIERLIRVCQYNRARSLSTPREISRPGRPSRVVQGEVGNVPQPRPRAQSERREHEEMDEGRPCVNCGQNPNQISDKVKLRRSVRVDKACDYCDGLVDSPEVCIRSTRHVCQKEECQKQAERSEDLEASDGG